LVYAFKVVSVPYGINSAAILNAMLGSQFAIYYDFSSNSTFMLTEHDVAEALKHSIPGFSIEAASPDLFFGALHFKHIVGFSVKSKQPFADAESILGNLECSIVVSFVPAEKKYVEQMKKRVEKEISKKEVRLTKSFSDRFSAQSVQSELYYDNEERDALLSLLHSLSDAMLANGTAFKVSVEIYGNSKEAMGKAYAYVKSKLFVLDEREISVHSVEKLFEVLRKSDALPLDIANASSLISFTEQIPHVYTFSKPALHTYGDIFLGNQLSKGVEESLALNIEHSTLNLGVMLSGLPGTGKTFEAMRIAEQASRLGTKIVIVSPTSEWNDFAKANGFNVISLYESKVPINFFKCDTAINIERFYENLAMLIAMASDAGPYTRSLEKVLLSAFHKAYKATSCPDPVRVYEAIEKAIIEQHAKKNNVGVEYTKHGENVRAALQNIRLMLMKPEFAYANGINISELIEKGKGVVFDLSNVSNNMKKFFYALILNQVYSITDTLSTDGDSELRLLVCLEEAQLAFEGSEYTAAEADLLQRIQDFRKKGVGMLLITHNATDINQNIRRLCQTKLYFRQSADVAKYAASDLIFNNEEKEELENSLKSLPQRVCAVNYVVAYGNSKDLAESVFIKVPAYTYPSASSASNNEMGLLPSVPSEKSMQICIFDSNGKPVSANIEVTYVGETVFAGSTDSDGKVTIENTLPQRPYTLVLLGEKKKDTRRFEVIGGECNKLVLA